MNLRYYIWIVCSCIALAAQGQGYDRKVDTIFYGMHIDYIRDEIIDEFYLILGTDTLLQVIEGGVRFGDGDDDEEEKSKVGLTDINQNAKPDLIVSTFSGGAHCCYNTYIFEYSKSKWSIIFEGREKDMGGYMFEDIDKDGIKDIYYYDDSFAYWNTSYAYSPAVAVYRKWDGRAYVYKLFPQIQKDTLYDGELTYTVPKYCQAFDELVEKVKENPAWSDVEEGDDYSMTELSDYWTTILNYLQYGKTALAAKFARAAWGTSDEDLNNFIKSFVEVIDESPDSAYYHMLNPDLYCAFEEFLTAGQ